jgi:hypothetical protein
LETEDRDLSVTGCAGEDWSEVIRCPRDGVY